MAVYYIFYLNVNNICKLLEGFVIVVKGVIVEKVIKEYGIFFQSHQVIFQPGHKLYPG